MGAVGEREAQAPMHSLVSWALLGLIIERPSYAYELARRFERMYDGVLALSSVSHVYTALATLRERGLVAEIGGSERAARSRRRFAATTEGLERHAEWLVGQVAEERRRQRLLVLQLGSLARTPEHALEVLDAYEQECLAEAQNLPASGAEELPGTSGLVARMIGEEARLRVGTKLRWAHFARAQLRALPQPRATSASR